MVFSLFWNIVSIAIISPQGAPLGARPGPKTNNILNFNNPSGTWPILDLNVSLDRACQGLKIHLKEQPSKGGSKDPRTSFWNLGKIF